MENNNEVNWLRLDELENAIDNLEMIVFFLTNIKSEKKWKWITLATHMALYGFAICGANIPPYQKVIKTSKRKPDGQLISIWDAIDKLKVPVPLGYPNDLFPILNLTESQEIAINTLVNDFRNNFEHFKPVGWSISEDCFPKMILEVIRVIKFIALESRRVNAGINDEDRIKMAIESIERMVMKINNESVK